MHRIAIDRRLVVTAFLLAASACGFQRAALAQDEEESGLRVPGAFSTESAYGGQSLRLDDRAGTDAPTVELVTERYANGKPYIERQVTLDTQGNYVNHGTWKMWAADGTAIAEGQYEMGQRVGTWTRWYGRNETGQFCQRPDGRPMADRGRRRAPDHADLTQRRQAKRHGDHLAAQRQDRPAVVV
jgi:hypothetical protein